MPETRTQQNAGNTLHEKYLEDRIISPWLSLFRWWTCLRAFHLILSLDFLSFFFLRQEIWKEKFSSVSSRILESVSLFESRLVLHNRDIRRWIEFKKEKRPPVLSFSLFFSAFILMMTVTFNDVSSTVIIMKTWIFMPLSAILERPQCVLLLTHREWC